MKKINKKKFTIAIIILIILGITMKILIKNTVKENSKILEKQEYSITYIDGTKKNTSKVLKKSKMLGNLKIINIELNYRDGVSNLIADIVNNGKEKTTEKNVKIDIINKEGNVIETLNGIINPINAGETGEINVAILADITDSYDFKISEIE